MDSRPAAGAGSTFTIYLPESKFHVHCWRMAPTIEKISAITFRVLNMKASVQFYRNGLGMELLYGGERACFSSLRAKDSESAILNLEQCMALIRRKGYDNNEGDSITPLALWVPYVGCLCLDREP